MTDSVLPPCPVEQEDIKRFLPHRPPFLLIDRILEYRLEEYLCASRHIPADDPVFKGHFPRMPLFPGVLTIESMAQAACMLHSLFLHQQSGGMPLQQSNLVPYLGGIKEARFRRAVHPGDTLTLQVRQVRRCGSLIQFDTEALVENKPVASASLSSFLKMEKSSNDS